MRKSKTSFVCVLLLTSLAAIGARAETPIEDPENPRLARIPAKDESVYVTQARAYSKRGHVELTPFVATPINNRWIAAVTPMLALTIHLRENIGLELIGGYQFNRYSAAQGEIQDREGASPLDAELKWMEWFVGADLQWAPFYGKLRLIPGVLGDYDLYFLAGFGVAGTRAPCEHSRVYVAGVGVDGSGVGVQGISGVCPDDPGAATLPAGTRFSGQFGAGVRIFFTHWLGVRLEFRDIVYSESVSRVDIGADGKKVEDLSTDIRHNVMFMFGFSLLI
jgi:outer membrane beta-barrel protein